VRAVDKPLTKDELIKDYGDVFKGIGCVSFGTTKNLST
jgi:hypothetical protein